MCEEALSFGWTGKMTGEFYWTSALLGFIRLTIGLSGRNRSFVCCVRSTACPSVFSHQTYFSVKLNLATFAQHQNFSELCSMYITFGKSRASKHRGLRDPLTDSQTRHQEANKHIEKCKFYLQWHVCPQFRRRRVFLSPGHSTTSLSTITIKEKKKTRSTLLSNHKLHLQTAKRLFSPFRHSQYCPLNW